jgi:hypothetical protein
MPITSGNATPHLPAANFWLHAVGSRTCRGDEKERSGGGEVRKLREQMMEQEEDGGEGIREKREMR